MIRVGPAGWSYKEWKGIVYPKRSPREFHELSYLAEFFDTVEINSSFYYPLSPKIAASWVEKVKRNNAFRFTAKLWRGFTHERRATDQDEQRVRDGFAPIVEAGRLGAVLLQFPASFRNTPEHRSYLITLCERFYVYPLVLEIRHSSWNDPEILTVLKKLGVGFCNTDLPILENTGRSMLVTSQTGYMRLHGLNYSATGVKEQYPGQRYDYLYSPEELSPLVQQMKAMSQTAKETYVIANNTYSGKGVVNSLQIASMLTAKRVPAPHLLVDGYPILQDFTVPSSATL